MNTMFSRLSRSVLTVYFWLIVLYLLLPIFIVLPMSFTASDFLGFPPREWGVRWYIEYFGDAGWTGATLLSIKVALMASVGATFVGTLAVIALSRNRFTFKTVLIYFMSAPLIIPHIFLAVGVFVLAVRLGMTNNEYILAGAHAAITLPFVVLIVGSAIKKIDVDVERAARVLGAGPVRAFVSASLPSLWPAILAAGMLSFFVSFDELIIAEFLLSSQQTLPMKIWADVRLELRPTVAAVSSILILVTSAAIITAEVLRQRTDAAHQK